MPVPSFRRSRRGLLGWLALAALPGGALALTAGDQKDVALRLKASGTVVSVDAPQRLLKVKGQRGTFTYRVDPKVTNLDQLKAGDMVDVDYVAAMAVTLRRGGNEMREQVESEAQVRAVESGQIFRGATVVTRVLALDKGTRMVKLKGPQGRVAEFRVQDVADLAGVRVGDRVVAVLYEAVAVGVVPVPR